MTIKELVDRLKAYDYTLQVEVSESAGNSTVREVSKVEVLYWPNERITVLLK